MIWSFFLDINRINQVNISHKPLSFVMKSESSAFFFQRCCFQPNHSAQFHIMHQIFSITAISESPEPKHLQSIQLGFVRSPRVIVDRFRGRTAFVHKNSFQNPHVASTYTINSIFDQIVSTLAVPENSNMCPSASLIDSELSHCTSVPFNKIWRICTDKPIE